MMIGLFTDTPPRKGFTVYKYTKENELILTVLSGGKTFSLYQKIDDKPTGGRR